MNKKQRDMAIRAAALALLALSAITPNATAANAQESPPAQQESIPIANALQPIVIEGLPYVPLRSTFEALGARITWLPATRIAEITLGPDRFLIAADQATAYANYLPVPMESPALIQEGRLYLPLSFLIDTLGLDAEWVVINRRQVDAEQRAEETERQSVALPERVETVSRGERSGGAAIAAAALRFIGSPYQWGGDSPAGFDCSGFTRYIFARFDIPLPRTSYEQALVGEEVSLEDLRPGDLLFFSTYASGPSHVGIATGVGDQFVHAGIEETGVITSSLSQPYWQARFLYARRVTP